MILGRAGLKSSCSLSGSPIASRRRRARSLAQSHLKSQMASGPHSNCRGSSNGTGDEACCTVRRPQRRSLSEVPAGAGLKMSRRSGLSAEATSKNCSRYIPIVRLVCPRRLKKERPPSSCRQNPAGAGFSAGTSDVSRRSVTSQVRQQDFCPSPSRVFAPSAQSLNHRRNAA